MWSSDTWISVLLKEIECLYHGHVQIERNFYSFIRADHYPELKTAKLSCTELEKVLIGAPRDFFKPSDLIQSLKTSGLFCLLLKSFQAWMKIKINNNRLPSSLFQNSEQETANQVSLA